VEKYLVGDEAFLANYSDNLTDFHLPHLVEAFYEQEKIAAFLCVRPSLTCHSVPIGNDGLVQQIKTLNQSEILINGGYFVFKQSIFDYNTRRRRARSGTVPETDCRKTARGFHVRRVLEEHGHLQGKAGAGRFGDEGNRSLAIVEAAKQRPGESFRGGASPQSRQE